MADEWGSPEPDVPEIAAETPATDATRPWPTWARTFLDLYGQTGNVMLSARGAGVLRQTPYQLKGRDPAFAQAWADADESATETLEAEAWRRAKQGSDKLIVFLLQARRPEVYRQRMTLDVSVRDEARRIAGDLGVNVEEALLEAERILAEARG